MSDQRLRRFILALILGLVPLLPPAHAQAATGASALSAARIAAIRDSGPPVMEEASRYVATAPPGNFVPSSGAPSSALATVSNPRLYREVFGFAYASSIGDPNIGYPSWNMSLLSTVAYFGLHVDWTGGFSDDSALAIWNDPNGPVPGLISTAHANGTKVVVTIIMMDSTNGTPNMCSALQRGSTTIANTVAQVNAKGIDGVNVDYESNNSTCTDPSTGATQSSQSLFTTFVAGMRSALPSGSYLSVDTYSGSAGYRSGTTYYGFFDIGALANYVDSFFVMAYDMEYSNWDSAPLYCPTFCIGPTAPLTTYLFNDSRASSEYSAVVAPSKVIMGIPYYGRKVCVGGYTPSNAPANAVASTAASADGYLDASTEITYYANSDYQTHRETRDAQGATRWDTFTSSTAQCTREMYWDDVTALGNKYDLVINNHLRGIGIWTLNYGGGAPELWSLINLKFGQCSRAAIAADHSVPQIPGTSVTFTGSALCAGTAQYRFWISPPSGGWTVTQPYGASPTWTWNTNGLPLGTYRIEVDARNLGSSVSYDTYAVYSFRLALCVTPTLATDKASPQLPGAAVKLTATVTCNGTPQYQVALQPPGGTSSVVQPYGSSATYSWSTTPGAYGTYNFAVSVRTAGTTVAGESIQNLSFALTSCTGTSLTTDKPSPQPTGTQVVLNASATCDGPAQYRFMIQPPGGPIGTVQDFGAGSSFTWNASGAGGTYGLEVDAKSASAPSATAWSSLVAYELASCAVGTLSVSPASPQMPGTAVTLTGGATCPATAQFKFLVHKPDGSTATLSDYGTSSSFSWNTTGLSYGGYGLEVDVRDVGAATAYETRASSTFTLAAAPCTTPTLTSDFASPQGTGATVTFSSTTTTCPQPLFKFWVQTPDATWHVMQDYGTASTFAWSASGPGGTYRVEVDVRDTTRPVAYDQFAVVSYVLTPCSAATLTVNKASPQMLGTTVVLTGGATCVRAAQYRFYVQANGVWSIVQDYGPSNTYTWTPNAGGNYRLEVDVRHVGATASYETFATQTYTINSPCSSASLAANPAGYAGTGTMVVLSGSAGGCPTPNYRFWVGQNGLWKIVQDYSATNTYSWNTASLAAGTYGLEVDVRNQGSTIAYDKVANLYYTLAPCTAATLSTNKASPQAPGTVITLTGGASCPGAAQFRFWVGVNGIWTIVQDFSASNTFSWDTTGKMQGTYGLEVDVRNQGSTVAYDKVANLYYALVTPPCTTPSFSGTPATQAGTGAHVTFTASTTGCPNPTYRFWISPPGQYWSIVQDYSATNTFTWTTTGAAGTYRLEVDVRDATASVAYDHVTNITYTLVPCSGAYLSTDKASPQKAGTQIVLTGSATCPGAPEYRFWVGQNGIWKVVQDFSPSNTFTWSTTGLAPGTYGLEVDVRDQGSTAPYEKVYNLYFAIT